MSDYSLETTDIHAGRLVWAPAVHQLLYEEHCHYFLIRLRDPSPTATGEIQDVLRQSQITSYCVYVLFGYYDVLLRLWASRQRRADFLARLDERGFIDRAEEFQSLRIDYLWNVNGKTQNVLDFKADVEEYAKCVALGETPSPALQEKLIDGGLLHVKSPARSANAIKFYLALSRLPGATPYRQEEDQIRLFSQELERRHGLSEISLYAGIGFAAYLIKTMADDYPAVLQVSREIWSELERLGLRPMTLLIANRDAPESELLNIQWKDYGAELALLNELLGRKYTATIAVLSDEDRLEISRHFRARRALLNTDAGPLVLSFFEARFLRDNILLLEKLSFVSLLEALLRRFFTELTKECLGSRWFEVVATAAREASVPVPAGQAQLDPKKFTLGHWIQTLGKLLSERELPAEAIDSVLGTGWAEKLNQTKALRNNVVHGELADRDITGAEWGGLLELACLAADLYERLKRHFATKG